MKITQQQYEEILANPSLTSSLKGQIKDLQPTLYRFVGCDYSGQEAVILSELLYPYDNGNLDNVINNGTKEDGTDLHSSNGRACGISRSAAKPVFFGLLYGASETLTGYTVLGDDEFTDYTEAEYKKTETKLLKRAEKINGDKFYPIKKGKMIRFTPQLVKQSIFGKRLQTKLKANLIGFAEMERDLKKQYKQFGYIVTPGGRKIHIDSPHKCVNYACQGYAAESMKAYLVIIQKALDDAGLVFGDDYFLQAIVYDEVDFLVKAEHIDTLKQILLDAFPNVSRHLNMKTTFTGEVLIGGVDTDEGGELLHPSWYGCH